ncbi:MAG: hypothetical protein DSY80_01665 [Desulfocapsa sp.]|nr:MAG: hypothetical protein DSY80_01665 [Desulfocapsa sp.]
MACDAVGLVDKETEGSPKIDELTDILDEICLKSGSKAVFIFPFRPVWIVVYQKYPRLFSPLCR